MSNRRVIPNDSKYDIVTFSILSEGKEIDPSYQVLSIIVTKEVNQIPTAKIIIRDGDAALETFSISESKDFIPGRKLEVKAGRDGKNDTVFKGIIVKHGIYIGEDGSSGLKIECKDESIKTTIGRKNRYFEKVKDNEVIKKILSESGVAGKVETTQVTHEELIQHYVSDWDFIMSRAEANGLLVIANDGKVDVMAPDTRSKEVLTVIYGSNLYNFEAEMDASNQWAKVEASSWDYKTQKLVKANATSVGFKENGNIEGEKLANAFGHKQFDLRHSGHVPVKELKAWAEGCLLKSRLAKIRGRAKFTGYALIRPGDMIKLEGVGARFKGLVYVTAIRHELIDGSWFTHAQFGLSPEWHYEKFGVIDSPAAGLVPAINGLQIGVVAKIDYDSDKEDRIQVKIPIIHEATKGIWCRVASLKKGKERGAFFRPEVGDEVTLGFINGDPRDAIVLGMLHSSIKPTSIKADAENTEKGFDTRENLKQLFNGNEKIITLETLAGGSLVIDDDQKSITLKDQHGNSITMDQHGITLDSKGKVIVKSARDLEIKAGTALKQQSGTELSLKAGTQLAAAGAAGAKLSTSAIMEIKGSLVKIN